MLKLTGSLAAILLVAAPLAAQQPSPGADPATDRCTLPDTIVVRGNSRVQEETVRGTAALPRGTRLNFRDIQQAIKTMFASGDYEDVKIICTAPPASPNVQLIIQVVERPVLVSTTIRGGKHVPEKDLKERLELGAGRPLDPAQLAMALTRADSLYESKGYYLAHIRVDSTVTDGQLSIVFDVDPGRRMAVSGTQVTGNKQVPTSAIVGAMKTKPEGLLWFQKGEFDDATYAGDLLERLPLLYGSRGYIDFRLLQDTVIVDRARGKAQINLELTEGPRYKIGTFEILGNSQMSSQHIESLYPFADGGTGQSLAQSAIGIVRRSHKNPRGTFDQKAWDDATRKVNEAYQDEGYMSARVIPREERVPSSDSVRVVNLRWEIQEGAPSIVNRIDIIGNDYTYESCIREQILMVPGDVFRRAYLIQSYQNIANLNFFDQPMTEPKITPANDSGDVNITFEVKEKRTGNLNFGASMGEGTGLGGFIGLDQPNLFGRCKRAQLNWQFGKYINDFTLTYQDPNIRQSRISGSVQAYHARARYQIADLGQSTRTGGQVQAGFPVPRSYFSRFFVSYSGEFVKYEDNAATLLGSLTTSCDNCFRSSVGLTFQRDTRLGMPFPTQGGMQALSASFNGGPLGGTASFQKYTAEFRSYAPLGSLGAQLPGSQNMMFLLGLSTRAGAVMGNPGPFFASQSFALGGTQYGEQLRGYCEFSITPVGYNPRACDENARQESFGNVYFVGTAELGFRVNQSLYLNTFFEGGNVWNRPKEFNPTRLYRSVGFGGSVISPLGPLGLDLAYGLDRVDLNGRRNPGWKIHFKLGQVF